MSRRAAFNIECEEILRKRKSDIEFRESAPERPKSGHKYLYVGADAQAKNAGWKYDGYDWYQNGRWQPVRTQKSNPPTLFRLTFSCKKEPEFKRWATQLLDDNTSPVLMHYFGKTPSIDVSSSKSRGKTRAGGESSNLHARMSAAAGRQGKPGRRAAMQARENIAASVAISPEEEEQQRGRAAMAAAAAVAAATAGSNSAAVALSAAAAARAQGHHQYAAQVAQAQAQAAAAAAAMQQQAAGSVGSPHDPLAHPFHSPPAWARDRQLLESVQLTNLPQFPNTPPEGHLQSGIDDFYVLKAGNAEEAGRRIAALNQTPPLSSAPLLGDDVMATSSDSHGGSYQRFADGAYGSQLEESVKRISLARKRAVPSSDPQSWLGTSPAVGLSALKRRLVSDYGMPTEIMPRQSYGRSEDVPLYRMHIGSVRNFRLASMEGKSGMDMLRAGNVRDAFFCLQSAIRHLGDLEDLKSPRLTPTEPRMKMMSQASEFLLAFSMVCYYESFQGLMLDAAKQSFEFANVSNDKNMIARNQSHAGLLFGIFGMQADQHFREAKSIIESGAVTQQTRGWCMLCAGKYELIKTGNIRKIDNDLAQAYRFLSFEQEGPGALERDLCLWMQILNKYSQGKWNECKDMMQGFQVPFHRQVRVWTVFGTLIASMMSGEEVDASILQVAERFSPVLNHNMRVATYCVIAQALLRSPKAEDRESAQAYLVEACALISGTNGRPIMSPFVFLPMLYAFLEIYLKLPEDTDLCTQVVGAVRRSVEYSKNVKIITARACIWNGLWKYVQGDYKGAGDEWKMAVAEATHCGMLYDNLLAAKLTEVLAAPTQPNAPNDRKRTLLDIFTLFHTFFNSYLEKEALSETPVAVKTEPTQSTLFGTGSGGTGGGASDTPLQLLQPLHRASPVSSPVPMEGTGEGSGSGGAAEGSGATASTTNSTTTTITTGSGHVPPALASPGAVFIAQMADPFLPNVSLQ